MDRDDFQAVVEILAKFAVGDHFGDVPIGCREEPNVDGDGVVRADPHDLSAFDHPQEFDLGGHRQVADLVEKEGAAVGEFESSLASSVRAGESAAFVAEKLAFEDTFRERGTVKGDERFMFSRAVGVERSSDQFFTGPVFAEDQDGGGGGGDEAKPSDHLVHGWGIADNPFEAELLIELLAKFDIGSAESMAFGRFADDGPEFVDVEGFGEVGVGPLLHGGDGGLDGAMPGDDDHLRLGEFLLGFSEDFQTVGSSHHQVGEDDIELLAFDSAKCFLTVGGDGTLVSRPFETVADRVGMSRLVVDDQYLDFLFGHGSCCQFGNRCWFVHSIEQSASLAILHFG